jgi:glyoxylase-like metal-dependent hydrolase (beta-lactamase superfamily II)
MKRLTLIVAGTLALTGLWSCGSQEESFRGIEHIAGDLYQYQDDNNTYSAFLVTPEGIILVDPINTPTATWLKAELKERFDVPVKYLIYSHSHDDHSSGAAVYDEAIVVGQENVVGEFDIWNDPSIEITDFDGFDHDPDEFIEFRKNNPAVFPDITFKDRMSIELGGKTVNLIYLGKGHSDNLIAVHFPEERAVLTIDLLWIDRVSFLDLPFKHYFPDLFGGLRIVEEMDFDILLTGHGVHGTGSGATGVKEDATEFREYFEAVYDEVITAMEKGLSKDEAVASIELPQFSHLGMYDKWFKMNVEGMYRHISNNYE